MSAVLNKLQKSGKSDVAVLDYSKTKFSFAMSTDGLFDLTVGSQQIPRNAIVFDRVLMRRRTIFYPQDTSEGEADFISSEFKALYRLIAMMFDERVVNTLKSRLCLVKPYQQSIAATAGFKTPQSLITNDKEAVKQSFKETNLSMIVKALGRSVIHEVDGSSRLIMTNRVSLADVASANSDEFAACPSFFQKEIRKDYELRVVCVGKKLFAYRIESQTSRITETDWRRDPAKLSYIPTTLPSLEVSKISRFMALSGFEMGSIDLVVDEGRQYWFLECNNQGAWGWLDQQNGACLSTEIANYLDQRAESELNRQDTNLGSYNS